MKTALLLSLFLFSLPLFSFEDSEPKTPLDFPLIDAPFNFEGHGYSFPSMVQSQALSKDFYQTGHRTIENAMGNRHPFLTTLTIAGFDVASSWLPLGNAWVHEEWHRAVMSRRNIASYNDVYNFKIFSNVIAVSHVTDADLIALKRDHPAEQVRLQSAGWEAEYELNLRLEKETFFFGERSNNRGILWLNTVGSSAYLFLCASPSADQTTDEQNAGDGSNIAKRDFTGLDCNGWVYDLFRPDEPYQNRGVHPSGVGINRYRKYSDLNDREKHFLGLTAALSLLNLADPFLIGLDRFGIETEWNTNLRFLPSSFGFTADANLFLKKNQLNLFIALHQYFNHVSYFPGIEVEILRYPIGLFSSANVLTTRGLFWLQPERQRYDSTKGIPGGLLSVKLSEPLSNTWELWQELEGKTEGWVAGNPFLDSNVSIRTGVIAHLF
jgi:hypothetical protein